MEANDTKIGPNVWDYTFDFHLTKNNQEWFVRFETGIKNDGKFVTDLNGFNFETHVHRKDLPTQAQVYPMPGYASIEDSSNRLTVLSTHAQGAASLVTGSLDIWIDRRLAQDDERGLGQGVQDNVRMTTTLRVILEDVRGTAPSHWVRRWWEDLEHPVEFFAGDASSGFVLFREQRFLSSSQRLCFLSHNHWSTPNSHRSRRAQQRHQLGSCHHKKRISPTFPTN